MQTATPIGDFVATDTKLRIRFSSTPITLQDVAAITQLATAIVAALESEVAEAIGEPIDFLPTVSVREGSLEFGVEIKMPKWSIKLKAKIDAVFVAAFLAAFPSSAGPADLKIAHEPSVACVERMQSSVDSAKEAWEFFGKDFKAKLAIDCKNLTLEHTVESPARKK